MSLVIGWTNPV